MTLFRTRECLSGDILEDCKSPENLGLCPKIYYSKHGNDIGHLAYNPATLAARMGDGLDLLAIMEEIALGFELGARTLFASVNRLLPWECIVDRNGKLVVETAVLGKPSTCILECLSDQVAQAFAEGVALELTGGLDSRLLLATGLRRGVKPKFAFTIGAPDSLDVMTAKAIADQYQFTHRNIALVVDQDRIGRDAVDFVRATGYAVNAACYAWIPATLAVLDNERTAQMTGLVGELAGSFYYTPLDSMIELLKLDRSWVKHRLMRAGTGVHRLWKSGTVKDLESKLIEEAIAALNRPDGTWRERTDLFYKNERIRRWALPVLDASNNYYTVVAPLLSPEYCNWAESLAVSTRVNRNAQRELLSQAHPLLADFRLPGKTDSRKSLATLSGKVLRRVLGKKRESALGAEQCATAFARDQSIRDLLSALIHEGNVGFSPECVEYLLENPSEHAELLGTLVTVAIAWHDQKMGSFVESPIERFKIDSIS